jgi:hypothetical protein
MCSICVDFTVRDDEINEDPAVERKIRISKQRSYRARLVSGFVAACRARSGRVALQGLTT